MKDIEKLNYRPFTRFCMSIGAVPSSYLAGLDIEEQILWLCSYLEKEVIPAVNNNGEAVEELQNLYIQLHDYVEHYFDNLDVQEEINNKLDAMAESGELEEIIASYLNTKAILCFDTVSDMKQSVNLVDGSYAKTLGYHELNDNGDAYYVITSTLPSTYYETLDNGLYAKLLRTSNKISVKQFGAYGDGTHDDTEAIGTAINSLEFGNTLEFNHNENYLLSDTLNLPAGANYECHNCNFIPNSNFTDEQFVIKYGDTILDASFQHGFIDYYLKDISIINSLETNINGIHIKQDLTLSSLYTYGLDRSVEVHDNYIDFVKITDVNVRGKRGNNYAIDTGYLGDSRELRRIHFHKQSMISENPNMLYVGSGHNSCLIDTYLNGNINITGSNVNIRNAHIELGNITISGSETNIESAYIYKEVGTNPFVITNSCVNLNNVLISYRNDNDYSNDSCIDLNIDEKSTINVTNVFKVMQGGIIGFKYYGGILSNNNVFNNSLLNHSINSLIRNNQITTNYKVTSPDFAGSLLATIYKDGNNKWKISSGTYYYKAICLFDKTRMVGFTSGGSQSIALTQTENAPFIATNGLFNSDIRLYRGNSDNQFDKYVDIGVNGNRIIDNGIICMGNKWQDRTAGASDSVLYSLSYELINKNNVKVYANSTPTAGTWKKGDIIIKSNPLSGNSYGWICVEDGTPGTWKAISTVAS